MSRKMCNRIGHRWVAWSPGGDPWCARWFCDAKRPSPVMALIERAIAAQGDEDGAA